MPHLLLIDDDDALRTMLRLVLETEGHHVVEAATGAEGLAKFRTFRPDLVITDLVMPDQDGLGVMMALRQEAPTVPIIVMSGGLIRSDLYRDMASKLGAKRVLAKPFPPADLTAAVTAALR